MPGAGLAHFTAPLYIRVMIKRKGKVVVLHGMTQEEAVAAMRAVKSTLAVKDEIAFAMSTESNLGWKLEELVEHVLEEHEMMTGQK